MTRVYIHTQCVTIIKTLCDMYIHTQECKKCTPRRVYFFYKNKNNFLLRI